MIKAMKRYGYFPNLCVIISAGFLSSCSFFSPVKVEEPTQYVLDRAPLDVPTKRWHDGTLFVQAPDTVQAYNTTQMAYTIKPHQIAYFSKNQWVETPSQMLQPLLVRTLQNTHHFRAVVTVPFTGNYHYSLNTQIIKLEQDFTRCPARLEMVVSAQLINAATNHVIASQLFSEQQPMEQRNPYAGVFAANHAIENILRRIAEFCLRHT